jgi:NADH-quinone oxidoreductase subunit N
MNNLQSLQYYYPEILLTILILVSIIYDLFLDKSKSDRVGIVLIAGLVLIAFSVFLQDEKITSLFTNSVAKDPFSQFFKITIILSTVIVSIISLKNEELKIYRKGEYFTLLGIVTFGLFLMVSAIDLIMLYLSIEIVSIISFVLAGYLKQNTHSNEAALKYVVYGGFSSGLMLFGLSYIFGLTGSTNYFEVQQSLSALSTESSSALIIAIIMMLAGFGYKISAVPFHFWTPDVYEGSPTTITAFLSVAPKAGAFAMMIRFFNQVLADGAAMQGLDNSSITEIPWAQILSIMAIITMTLGNLVAIQQNSIKRMLAYSSVAHAGYMLLAMPVMSGDSIYAIMIYLIMYLFMNLGAFTIVVLVKNKTGGESFDDFKGLGWEMPFVGALMTLFMVSLTGLPPTAGFVGKFYIFASLIKGGEPFYYLVFIGGLNSVISLYYYLRVVKIMYFSGKQNEVLKTPGTVLGAILLLTGLPTLFLGIYWAPLATWVQNSLVFFIQTI